MTHRFLALTIAVAGLAGALLAPGCTLLSSSSAVQCETDADCRDLGDGFGAATCSAEQVCVLPTSAQVTSATSSTSTGAGGGEPGGCVSNEQCAAENGGLPYVCIEPGEPCKSLLSEDCTFVLGDFANNDAIIFGYMSLFTGGFKFIGANHRGAAEMALNEIEQAVGGIPGQGGVKRPLVMVGCDEVEDPVRAAEFLVDELGVKAIVGPSFSDDYLPVANEVTIPNDVFLLGTSAATPLLLDLNDNGLAWSVCPNDASLVPAMAAVVSDIEEEIRVERPLEPTEDVKVAVLVLNDASGLAKAELLTNALEINGEPVLDADETTFRRIDYPDPSDEVVDFGPIILQLLEFQPDIIAMYGNVELNEDILPFVEADWPAGVPRPQYIYDVTGADITAFINGDEELRSRVRGVQSAVFDREQYKSFVVRYKAFNDGLVPGPCVEASYDAIYVLAYGILAAGNVATSNLTGELLAGGVAKLTPPGTPLDVGPLTINNTMSVLQAGGDVDLVGTSGDLDFDVATGNQIGDVEVWCVTPGGDFVSAGQLYRQSDGVLEGEFECPVE